ADGSPSPRPRHDRGGAAPRPGAIPHGGESGEALGVSDDDQPVAAARAAPGGDPTGARLYRRGHRSPRGGRRHLTRWSVRAEAGVGRRVLRSPRQAPAGPSSTDRGRARRTSWRRPNREASRARRARPPRDPPRRGGGPPRKPGGPPPKGEGPRGGGKGPRAGRVPKGVWRPPP